MAVSKSMFQRVLDFLFANRIQLSFFIVIICMVEDIMEKVRPHDIISFSDFWGTVGLILVLVGALLRSWAAGVVHKGKQLQTTGPYALARHPLYVGSFLIAIGFCAIIGDGENIWVVLFLGLVMYLPKIREEEAVLSKRFGEAWDKYKKETSFISLKVPTLSMFSEWSFSQWRRNKEYYTFFTSLVMLTALELIRKLLF